jgi:hypothetical protein
MSSLEIMGFALFCKKLSYDLCIIFINSILCVIRFGDQLQLYYMPSL